MAISHIEDYEEEGDAEMEVVCFKDRVHVLYLLERIHLLSFSQ